MPGLLCYSNLCLPGELVSVCWMSPKQTVIRKWGKKESHGLLKLLLRVQKPGEAIKHLSTNSSLIGLINPVHN